MQDIPPGFSPVSPCDLDPALRCSSALSNPVRQAIIRRLQAGEAHSLCLPAHTHTVCAVLGREPGRGACWPPANTYCSFKSLRNQVPSPRCSSALRFLPLPFPCLGATAAGLRGVVAPAMVLGVTVLYGVVVLCGVTVLCGVMVLCGVTELCGVTALALGGRPMQSRAEAAEQPPPALCQWRGSGSEGWAPWGSSGLGAPHLHPLLRQGEARRWGGAPASKMRAKQEPLCF